MKKFIVLSILLLPFFAANAQEAATSRDSLFYHGYYGWLHPGLNARFGLETSVAWGKGSPKGVGFGQNVSLVYATPLNKRLFFAGELYASHYTWSGNSGTNLGFSAMLDYQINEKWNVFACVVKNFTPNVNESSMPYFFPYDYNASFMCGPLDTRITVGTTYKINDHTHISFSFSHSHYGENPHFFNPYTPVRSGLVPYRGIAW